MTKTVYAAGLIAQKLHKGQTDKGGNDYFLSHLLTVATKGTNWKETVVGFLHDATEDCDVTADQVIEMLDAEITRISSHPKDNPRDEDWWQAWMEYITPSPDHAPLTDHNHPILSDTDHDNLSDPNRDNRTDADHDNLSDPDHDKLTDTDRDEIKTALMRLNHHTAPTREEYIRNISTHPLALRVKLHDLENNMDLSRIPHPAEKDLARLTRYRQEYQTLLAAL